MNEATEVASVDQGDGGVEGRGSTLDEAIASALDQLGISRDAAAVEVLSEGTRSVPGERLVGVEARVRVTPADERTGRAVALLEELLDRMGLDARVSVRRGTGRRDATQPTPFILDVSGEDLGLLIGWRGETLYALQTMLNLIMGEDNADSQRLIVDVERYRARREEQVKDLARRSADRVTRTGERATLDPMHPYERRAVHLALEDDAGVRTESIGKDPARRIVIHPMGPAQPGLPERFSPAGAHGRADRSGERPARADGGDRRPQR